MPLSRFVFVYPVDLRHYLYASGVGHWDCSLSYLNSNCKMTMVYCTQKSTSIFFYNNAVYRFVETTIYMNAFEFWQVDALCEFLKQNMRSLRSLHFIDSALLSSDVERICHSLCYKDLGTHLLQDLLVMNSRLPDSSGCEPFLHLGR